MGALAIHTEEQSIDFMYRVKTKDIQKLLLDIGFPHHVYGYNYISYALELIMLDPEMLHHVTKELYPDVASHFHTTSARVERAIRTAIQIVWLYGNRPLINNIFGNTIRADKGVPTNSQLLAGLYYYLRERYVAYN